MNGAPVLWHEIECGAYEADLPFWSELAAATPGPVLDLGCGSGRVGIHLAKRGHEVTGIDLDSDLVAAFNDRAAGLKAEAVAGDAAGFELNREFGLALGPMQLLQILDDEKSRERCLSSVASHLRPGGRAAFAIVENLPAPVEAPPPLPDAREVDGWVYSSLPLETGIEAERIVVRRLRQTVSPQGHLSDELDEVPLRRLSAATLEDEADQAGLRPTGRHAVEPTADHVGSTIVLLEKES